MAKERKTGTGKSRLRGAVDGKPWEKGVSGNPKGRPANSITSWMKRMVDATFIEFSLKLVRPGHKDKDMYFKIDVRDPSSPDKSGSIGQAIAAVILQQALQGDYRSAAIVLDRTDGPVTQKLDLSNMTREEMIAIISQMAK